MYDICPFPDEQVCIPVDFFFDRCPSDLAQRKFACLQATLQQVFQGTRVTWHYTNTLGRFAHHKIEITVPRASLASCSNVVDYVSQILSSPSSSHLRKCHIKLLQQWQYELAVLLLYCQEELSLVLSIAEMSMPQLCVVLADSAERIKANTADQLVDIELEHGLEACRRFL